VDPFDVIEATEEERQRYAKVLAETKEARRQAWDKGGQALFRQALDQALAKEAKSRVEIFGQERARLFNQVADSTADDVMAAMEAGREIIPPTSPKK